MIPDDVRWREFLQSVSVPLLWVGLWWLFRVVRRGFTSMARRTDRLVQRIVVLEHRLGDGE